MRFFFIVVVLLLLSSFTDAKIFNDTTNFVGITQAPYMPFSMIIPTSAPNFLLLVSGTGGVNDDSNILQNLILTSVSLESKPPKIVDTLTTNIICDQYNTQFNDLYLYGWVLLGSCQQSQHDNHTTFLGFESALIQLNPTSGKLSILDQTGFSDTNSLGYRSIGSDNFFNGRDPPTVIYAKEQAVDVNYNDTVTPIIISIDNSSSTRHPSIKITRPSYEMCCLNDAYIFNGISFYSKGFISLYSYYLGSSLYQFSTTTGQLLYNNTNLVGYGGMYAVAFQNTFTGFVITMINASSAAGIQPFDFSSNKNLGKMLIIPGIGYINGVVGGPVIVGDNLFFVMNSGNEYDDGKKMYVMQIKVGRKGEIGEWNKLEYNSWGTRSPYEVIAASAKFVVVMNTNGYKNFAAGITAYSYN
eukprot:TRINITY_DN1073_c0_g1_i2.p1 TRINITY_DN1073_c0_g1~~TRINITY_DN1073_c0_g1_i2.p1  ORF type:complete len:413 (-),score=73.48 TRINITY_DN1073_c0_g1_i2:138-1376(-)